MPYLTGSETIFPFPKQNSKKASILKALKAINATKKLLQYNKTPIILQHQDFMEIIRKISILIPTKNPLFPIVPSRPTKISVTTTALKALNPVIVIL